MSGNALPPSWTVSTHLETNGGPIDIGQTKPRAYFSRWTTTVRDGAGNFVCSDADQQNAIGQALAICQQRQQPYDSSTWPYP